ncbi:transcription elongation factor GreAB [Neorhizobium sp. T25_13]|uniref:transcription elongation factor GreAB n=1 Tax=Neorhizobium sp. T25_13 TaxID=2093830 RepID=UPI000CF8E2AD|nr:transcription elongation factor GreAB [Neorhizobium sp. T25_13]
MSREVFCQLTAGDANVLMSMLEQEADRPSPFSILLREKLNHSDVYFREDIPPNVVTIDTQVAFTVNGLSIGPQILVRNAEGLLPSFALSLHSMRGLAILGLAVGQKTEFLTDDGHSEVLSVQHILFQPEAEARLKQLGQRLIEPIDHAPQVVSFRPRPRRAVVSRDDDPDPSAA